MRLSVSVFILRTQSERYIDYTPVSDRADISAYSSIILSQG